MKLLELFAGTKSIGNEFLSAAHEVFSVEWDKRFKDIQLYKDIEFLEPKDIPFIPDVIWASPDCTTYSVAGLRYHRNYIAPKSEYAEKSDRVNQNLWDLIDYYLEVNPNLIYFVENPRGMYRKMPFTKNRPRFTVTYCQYGDTRMKPTDIFTNYSMPRFKEPCINGATCHRPAPRGSNTKGTTQGLKKIERSIIPKKLCEHILFLCHDLEIWDQAFNEEYNL